MDKIELLQQMSNKNEKDGKTWYLLGREYIRLNEHVKAFEAFSNAINYAKDDIYDKVLEELMLLEEIDESNKQEEDIIIEKSDIFDQDEMYDNAYQDDTGNIAEQKQLMKNDNVIELKVVKDDREGEFVPNEKVTFEHVGGLTQLKKTINMKIIKPFLHNNLFSKFKKKNGGGILLYGPPGCGKTFIGKATAGECNATFTPVHISDILDPYMGVSSRNVRDIFMKARDKKPSVLFFDELDTIGFSRNKSRSDLTRPVIDQFLVELEGIESSNDDILVIGATNTPWDIDVALKRPGRFDKMIFVAPPDIVAREEIFKLKLSDKPICKNIDYRDLASKTPLYSGADIEYVCDSATEIVIEEIMESEVEREINHKDLLIAISRHRATTIEWLNTVKNYVKYANSNGDYDDIKTYLDKNRKFL